ncbi:Lysophospholipase L1 [Mariniphaga anaerophila]|uniref:Lysophospholipase L1 n=1 Tax=Mariniphaga anaerophila TaxID=1484053 RepID=A0A1M5G4Q5_9BACT|nr:SGNH/GDSL hydrolase family protein [Mariniphaga anaerophila]SHF98745.1 Lysophospholipase L1 [Mariniphaga anaerophila]
MKNSSIIRIVSIFFISVLWNTAFAQTDKNFYPATNDVFVYMGRVHQTGETVKYNWPGVTVSTDFTGKELGIKIKGGDRNYFNVWVDDRPEQVLHAVNDTVWWYPEKLSKGLHHLKIVKRTEGDMGIAEFSGVFVGKKEQLQKPAPLSHRKILFIGNSITCGYGTEGLNKSEDFKPSTENCEKSYAPIIARAFDAQFHLIAHSGLGIIRNYGDKDKISTRLKPMPARLEYLMDNDSTLKYDLQNYIPDAIVVNLGTNDFSTQPFPDEEDFIVAGKKLLTTLKKEFPQAKIICVTGPMTNEPCFSCTKKIVEQSRANLNTTDIVFVGIPNDLLNKEDDLGSDWHPSYRGQLKSAHVIIPVLENMLGWKFSLNEILENLYN